MGRKPALRFSSRRASAFQRPWMASGSSKGVRARQPLYHGPIPAPKSILAACGRAALDGTDGTKDNGRGATHLGVGIRPQPPPFARTTLPRVFGENSSSKAVKMRNLQAAILKQNR